MTARTTRSLDKRAREGDKAIYRDRNYPWVEYIGYKPGSVRNRWFVHDIRMNTEEGPFHSRRQAADFVTATYEPKLADYISTNGSHPRTVKGEAEMEDETPVWDGPGMDQLIEFSCPHCGGRIQGLLARK